jgi:hypothetical protein
MRPAGERKAIPGSSGHPGVAGSNSKRSSPSPAVRAASASWIRTRTCLPLPGAVGSSTILGRGSGGAMPTPARMNARPFTISRPACGPGLSGANLTSRAACCPRLEALRQPDAVGQAEADPLDRELVQRKRLPVRILQHDAPGHASADFGLPKVHLVACGKARAASVAFEPDDKTGDGTCAEQNRDAVHGENGAVNARPGRRQPHDEVHARPQQRGSPVGQARKQREAGAGHGQGLQQHRGGRRIPGAEARIKGVGSVGSAQIRHLGDSPFRCAPRSG